MDAKEKKSQKFTEAIGQSRKKHEVYAQTVKCVRRSTFFVNSVRQ